jgi:WD40 repeat protein
MIDFYSRGIRKNLLALSLAVLASPALALAEETTEPVPVRAVAFSPDGSQLAVGFGDREVAGGLLLWRIGEKRIARVVPTKVGVSSLAFSSTRKYLAFSTYGHAPQVLSWPSLELYAELEATRRGPVAFSPDGTVLATGCEDHNVYLWDAASRMDKRSLEGHRDNAYTIAFSPDGSRLISAAQPAVQVWDVASGEKPLELKHGRSLNSSAAFSPDGSRIITGGWDGMLRIWDAASGEPRAKLHGWGGVERFVYSSKTKTLALIGTETVVGFYELSFDPPPAESVAQIEGAVKQLDDDSYDIREAASAQLVKTGLLADAELARLMKESPSAEVRIRARRARQAITSQPQTLVHEHTARTRCLALSPAGTLLASGADDGLVHLWDIAARKSVESFSPAELARNEKRE